MSEAAQNALAQGALDRQYWLQYNATQKAGLQVEPVRIRVEDYQRPDPPVMPVIDAQPAKSTTPDWLKKTALLSAIGLGAAGVGVGGSYLLNKSDNQQPVIESKPTVEKSADLLQWMRENGMDRYPD